MAFLSSIALTQSELHTLLTTYTSLSSPGYALLVHGPWGSGKTYAVKAWLTSVCHGVKDSTSPLYVSLNGLRDVQAIEARLMKEVFRSDHLFAGLIERLERLPHAVTSTIETTKYSATQILNKKYGVELEVILKEAWDVLDFQGRTLVFDDLERAALGMEELLGYINQFVEHRGCHAILLADWDELKARHRHRHETEPLLFEKLVGKRVLFKAVPDEAFDAFVQEVVETCGAQVKSFWSMHKGDILSLFQASRTHNLRHLRRVVLNLSPFLKEFLPALDELEALTSEKKSEYKRLFVLRYTLIFVEMERTTWQTTSQADLAQEPLALSMLEEFQRKLSGARARLSKRASERKMNRGFEGRRAHPPKESSTALLSLEDRVFERFATLYPDREHMMYRIDPCPIYIWEMLFEGYTTSVEDLLVYVSEFFGDVDEAQLKLWMKPIPLWTHDKESFREAFEYLVEGLAQQEVRAVPVLLHFASLMMYLLEHELQVPPMVHHAEICGARSKEEVKQWILQYVRRLGDQATYPEMHRHRGFFEIQMGWGGFGFLYTGPIFRELFKELEASFRQTSRGPSSHKRFHEELLDSLQEEKRFMEEILQPIYQSRHMAATEPVFGAWAEAEQQDFIHKFFNQSARASNRGQVRLLLCHLLVHRAETREMRLQEELPFYELLLKTCKDRLDTCREDVPQAHELLIMQKRLSKAISLVKGEPVTPYTEGSEEDEGAADTKDEVEGGELDVPLLPSQEEE